MPLMKFEGGPYDGTVAWFEHISIRKHLAVWLEEPRAKVRDGVLVVIDKGLATYYRSDIVTMRGEILYIWIPDPAVEHLLPALDLPREPPAWYADAPL